MIGCRSWFGKFGGLGFLEGAAKPSSPSAWARSNHSRYRQTIRQEPAGRATSSSVSLCSSRTARLLTAAIVVGLGTSSSILAQERGQRPGLSGPAALGNFSVLTQHWRRYPGLAVADIIFNNENGYAVRNVIVTCEFLDRNGNAVATRGSTIFQSFPPASTIKIDNVYFSLREKNAVPGSCRALSASNVTAP